MLREIKQYMLRKKYAEEKKYIYTEGKNERSRRKKNKTKNAEEKHERC